MTDPKPRLLLVPAFTELQWTITPQLEEWAEVAAYDPPGVGDVPLPDGLALSEEMSDDERRGALRTWRDVTARRGLDLVDELGWDGFLVVGDGEGIPNAVRLAELRPDSVEGIALGHAALSRSTEGERPAVNKEVHAAMGEFLKTDSQGFIRHGIAQATAGSVSEELADRMVARFPEHDVVVGVWEMLTAEPEPIGDALESLGVPLLLGQHVGCLGMTEEGFQDIVARFPEARTVRCPEACSVSESFAEALREFCAER